MIDGARVEDAVTGFLIDTAASITINERVYERGMLLDFLAITEDTFDPFGEDISETDLQSLRVSNAPHHKLLGERIQATVNYFKKEACLGLAHCILQSYRDTHFNINEFLPRIVRAYAALGHFNPNTAILVAKQNKDYVLSEMKYGLDEFTMRTLLCLFHTILTGLGTIHDFHTFINDLTVWPYYS